MTEEKKRDWIDWAEIGISLFEVVLTIVITWMIWKEVGFGSRQETAAGALNDAVSRQAKSLDALATKENEVADSLDKMNRVLQAEERILGEREVRDVEEASRKPEMKLHIEKLAVVSLDLSDTVKAKSSANQTFELRITNNGKKPLINGAATFTSDVANVSMNCAWGVSSCSTLPTPVGSVGSAAAISLGTLLARTTGKLELRVQRPYDSPDFQIHVLIGGENLVPLEIGTVPVVTMRYQAAPEPKKSAP